MSFMFDRNQRYPARIGRLTHPLDKEAESREYFYNNMNLAID